MNFKTLQDAATRAREEGGRHREQGRLLDASRHDAIADWLDADFAHRFGPTAEAITVAQTYLGVGA